MADNLTQICVVHPRCCLYLYIYSDTVRPPYEMRLIAKVAPKLKFRREMYNIPTLFRREKFMYNQILPEFRAFQEKHLLPGQPMFDNYPRMIQSSDEPGDEFILLNDICEEGYSNFVRSDGCSMAISKLILQSFARLHAVSFVFQAQDKEKFDRLVGDGLKETLYGEDISESFELFLQTKIDLIHEKLTGCPAEDTDALVFERMKVFRRDCAKEMYAACHVRDYAVVCHGDSWISNFMFKVSEVVHRNQKSVELHNTSFCI